MYGPILGTTMETADLAAPAAPSFVSGPFQLSNKLAEVNVLLPTEDFGGEGLTGLTKVTLATALVEDGVNPFDALSMEQILASQGVQVVEVPVTPEQAGTPVRLEFPVLAAGHTQAIAIACAD